MPVKKNSKRFVLVAAGILIFSILAVAADDQAGPFILGGMKALPGETVSGYLDVAEKDGVGTRIPVTIIHGRQKGTILALVAGIHGAEYPPILALYRLKQIIDPKKLTGTLVLVHIANLPSFQRRTVYYNPFDWKNLNRVFPGDDGGTLSPRIAAVLNREIIQKSDCLIDLHCGDANEALIPYTYWMISEDKALNEETKKMALAFGLRHIIIDDTKSKDRADSKYFGNTAILGGKPSITTEAGFLGRTDEEFVARNINGSLSVMRHFGMIEGKPEPVTDPVWIDKFEVMTSNGDGLFYPLAEMGHDVVEGQKIGTVTDFLGNVTEEMRAPFSGILLYIINTPPISKGEPVCEIGRIKGN
ncbi:MAG: M14 family metallopeptidase [Candidatus Aminicenantes bacterium]|nr:M14 family metallopeptidase [Candidatus Aminicenantes bacterium]